MARTYKRDSRGRFAGGGGGGSSRPKAKPAPRGTNRLTRNNAGQITGTGNGATARGGRLRTAGGKLRATQTAKLKGAGGRLRGGKAAVKQKAASGSRKGKNRISAERTKGTLRYRDNLAPTKELARLSKTVRKYKDREFEPPSAANNFQSRGLGARKALESLNPRLRTLRSLQADNSYRQRMAVSKANRKFEQQRAVNTGALSGRRVTFRSAKAAAGRYTGRIQDMLAGSRTRAQNRASVGMRRTKVGEQFNLLGRPTPIKSARRTGSNYNADTYRMRRRRGRLINR